MTWIVLAISLAGSPGVSATEMDTRAACDSLSRELQPGSLLFGRGDCLAVKVYSASSYTHVGVVVVEAGRITVYDATGGAGVRKQSLNDYLNGQGDAVLYACTPKKQFSKAQCLELRRSLEGQLGREYGIAHHVTGQRAAGLHCAEYATDALIAADVLTAKQPARVSPASLREGVLRGDIYATGSTIQLQPLASSTPRPDGWCAGLWFDTKQCTYHCYVKMQGWFCCK